MTTVYEGRVFSGVGRGSTRVRQNMELYSQSCGIDFVPGTLNVALTEEFRIPPGSIYLTSDKIRPAEKDRGVTLVPARLGGERVVIIIPDRSPYGRSVVEVMASFNIREKLGLKDGDMVRIAV
ncbi:MAG: CTP-dependent riboflavin kinase [Chloroflexi bacterium]|nr:CTP-dependent riboflavin kinase [Chloroflexota bacterium]